MSHVKVTSKHCNATPPSIKLTAPPSPIYFLASALLKVKLICHFIPESIHLTFHRKAKPSKGTRERTAAAGEVPAHKQASAPTIEIPNPAFTSNTPLKDNHLNKDTQLTRQRTKLPLPTVEDSHEHDEGKGNYEELDKYEDLNHRQDSIHNYEQLKGNTDEYMEIIEPPDG